MNTSLARLFGILKGILLYKQEQQILQELIKKYRYESVKLVKDNYPEDCIISAIG